ncbi:MAG: YihY/virulence factor BrkB family protein [Bacteroidales bacterium]|jgi:membrane protein|nr:YihY/virulence factor BrkB family protein [Bacteroidales bacterium]
MKSFKFHIRRTKYYIKKTIHFFTIKIWLISAQVGLSTFKKAWYKVSRILSIAIEKFVENRCPTSASDLTYYTLFAVVPFFAIAYGVAISMGMETVLNEQIYSAFSGQGALSEKLIEFAQKTIAETKGGLVTIVASAFFLWAIFSMLESIETNMNQVWNVDKKRNFGKRMLGYLLFTIFGPVLLVAGSGVNIFISANIIEAIADETIQNSLSILTSFLIPIAVFSFLFFLIYQVVPNRKIKIRSSLVAAIIAGAAFQILQYYYFNIQMSISAYNTIYGSFAVLPLLLIWVRMSWMIVLFGAELAFAIEHENDFISSRQSRQPFRKP